MQVIKDASFDSEILRNPRPTVVVFHAKWNSVSKIAVNLITDLRANFGDLVELRGMDVDENPMTPCQYGVDALPCFIVLRDGRVVNRTGPGFDRAQLQRLFEVAIAVD